MSTPLSKIEGKYEILEKIREGGMGAVYKVRHRLLGDLRVIKVMRPQLTGDAELQRRFRREAKAAIRLAHPHIAQLYDFTVDDEGTAYIAMELIRGLTLEDLLERGEVLPVALSLEISRQCLYALGYIHRQGMVHRDISPDNLMLTRDVDRRPAVKLIDLGLAKLPDATGERTGSGVFLGKFRYASPEHFGHGELGPASDLYSFGLVLYELLTGRYPIVGETATSLIAGHLFREPLGFEDTDPEGRVPEDLRQIVRKALAKPPEQRFRDAEAFAEALVPAARSCEELGEGIGSEEVRRLLDLTCALSEPRAGESGDNGSAQSRLDQSFTADPTPLPTLRSEAERLLAGSLRRDPVGSAAGRSTEETLPAPADLLSATARNDLLRTGEFLALDDTVLKTPAPGTVQVGTVKVPPVPGEPAPDEPRTAGSGDGSSEALRQAVAEIEGHIAASRFTAARERLRAVVESEGRAAELVELAGRIDEIEEIDGRSRMRKLIRVAQAAVAEKQYEQALAALAEAAELAPGERDVRTLLDETRRAARRHAAEVARNRAIEHRAAEIAQLLEAGDLEAGEAELRRATEHYGKARLLSVMRRRLGDLRREARAREVGRCFAEGRTLAKAGALSEAVPLLRQVTELDPDHDEGRRLLAEVRERLETEGLEARRREQKERRAAAIRRLRRQLETWLREDELEQAASALRSAEDEWGPSEALDALRARLDEHLRRQELSSRVEAWVREAEELRSAGRFEEAMARARQALELAPLNKLLQLLVFQLEQDMTEAREYEERDRERRAAEEEIRDLVLRGELAEASRRLPAALDTAGATVAVNNLQDQVAEGWEPPSEEERVTHRRHARELVVEARSLAQGEEFLAARDRLREAVELDPDSAEALALSASVDACLEVQREEAMRTVEIEQTASMVRSLLAAGETETALRDLRDAGDRLGDDGTLRVLRYEAVQARLAEEAVVGTPEGRTPEGRTAEGRTADGRTPEGRTPDGRTPDDAIADRTTVSVRTEDLGLTQGADGEPGSERSDFETGLGSDTGEPSADAVTVTMPVEGEFDSNPDALTVPIAIGDEPWDELAPTRTLPFRLGEASADCGSSSKVDVRDLTLEPTAPLPWEAGTAGGAPEPSGASSATARVSPRAKKALGTLPLVGPPDVGSPSVGSPGGGPPDGGSPQIDLPMVPTPAGPTPAGPTPAGPTPAGATPAATPQPTATLIESSPRRRFDEISLKGIPQLPEVEPIPAASPTAGQAAAAASTETGTVYRSGEDVDLAWDRWTRQEASAPPGPASPAHPPGRGQRIILAGASVLVVAVSLLAGLWLARRGWSPTSIVPLSEKDEPPLEVEDVGEPQLTRGLLVVDAAPWARIDRLLGPDERPVTLPSPYTPVSLRLPVGTYRAVLFHPPTGRSAEVRLEVRIGDPPQVPRPVLVRLPNRGGPGPLRQASAAFLSGSYKRTVDLASGGTFSGTGDQARALLLRAAARAALHWRDGELDPAALRSAESDIRACKRVDPSVAPDDAFSPRFRDLFAATR